MEHDGQKEDDLSGKPWHLAFFEALQMELQAYQDALTFDREHQLANGPLKIDCVVVKKAKNVVIKKNIAAIFRGWNLLEYKSPGGYVSVDDFYKVYGYACLYKSFERVPITSLTVSFVESRYPGKLFKHLENARHYKVEENSPGIYTVKGDIIPIQVIDSRRLSPDENLWLKSLSNRLDPLSVIQLNDEIIRLGKAAKVKAYVDVIAKANYHAVEEAMEMGKPAKSLEEVLERTGVTARAEAKGKAEGALEIARNLVSLGIPAETVISATGLDPEKVKAFYHK